MRKMTGLFTSGKNPSGTRLSLRPGVQTYYGISINAKNSGARHENKKYISFCESDTVKNS